MTLEKPKTEECGNCYYCISWIDSETTGILSKKITNTEIFACRRFPPFKARFEGGTYGPHYMNTHCNPNVKEDYWCGEWRRRK
jgi:hypothetical protein